MGFKNWGRVNHSTSLFRGCRKVSCEGHGGILVTIHAMMHHPYFKKLREYPHLDDFLDGGQYVFEEDCDASVVLSTLPDEFYSKLAQNYLSKEGNTLQRLRDIDAQNLIRSYPELYTFFTGRELSIFESEALLNQQIQHCETRLCFRGAAWGDWAWDVPEGYVYFICVDQHNIEWGEGYLAPEKEFTVMKRVRHNFPIDVSGLQTFTPDRTLPYSKRDAA